jgi:hypothetical protein
MSLGSIVKAAERHCDRFVPSSPADGRVRIVNSVDPSKNSTFLRRRGILRRGTTRPFLPSGLLSMKMTGPRAALVNHGDLSLRTTSKIGGALTRIHNLTPRNHDFHRTKFQRVICSKS